jgi:hypothetical protein
MRTAKLGAVAALIVLTALSLLWVTEFIPRDEISRAAPKAFGAVAILVLAGLAWSVLRGNPAERDETDKRVP